MEQSSRLPIFRERLETCRKEMEVSSNTEFAKILGISRQTLGFYLNGNRIPDCETLAQICKRCSRSADWLLGLSDDPNIESPTVDQLGLSPAAVERLRKQVTLKLSDNLSGLSAIIEDGRMLYLAGEIERFRSMVEKRIRYAEENNYTSYLTGDFEVIEDHNSYKQDIIDDEQLDAHTLQQRIEDMYPSAKGKFRIIAGAQMIESEKQHLVNVFDQILCKITCFNQYREGVDLEYLSQTHDICVLDHEVD